MTEPAPAPAAPEPEPAKPKPKPEPKTEHVDGTPAWPQTVQARVVKGVDAKAKNPDDGTTFPVRVVELSGGTLIIDGQPVDTARAGRFIMDPSRPELAKFGAVSDETIEFTVTREKSKSDPTKHNLIITRAALADVAM